MYLKHLELQGFKSFASKSTFAFPSRVVAVVGPNGSGKSNIADAIRWVLGEQSYSALRAKRTDELIFSGSEGRPRAGLAEVNLTLDNSSGWLPIEFSEVTISRQATRDSQNKYFINGSQVRLRDIAELLSQSGLARRTYAVVGQGLMDQALSLRPEERRALFEEAAGITLYQSKREEALRKLDEANHNRERARDILDEIGPRLRRLERQAERAEEYDRLNEELHAMLKTFYGYHWGCAQAGLHDARTVAHVQAGAVARYQAELDALTQRLSGLREQQASRRAQLHGWQRQANMLRTQFESARRELAVLDERRRLLAAQQTELEATSSILQTQRAEQAEQLTQAQARLETLRQEATQTSRHIAQAQQALHEREKLREGLYAQRSRLQKRAAQLAEQLAERRTRRVQLAERQVEIQRSQAACRQEQTKLQSDLDRQRQQAQQLEAEIAALGQKEEELRARVAECTAHMAESRQRQARLDEELAQARAAEAALHARQDALGKVRAALSDYSAGAQAVLKANVPGVRGVLAMLIAAPSAWERAIEAALGLNVQALVVDTWQAMLTARQRLRQASAFATFIVLEGLADDSSLDGALSGGDGLRRASSLVTCDPAVHPAVQALLGRTLLMDRPAADLQASDAAARALAEARAALARLAAERVSVDQIVTPQGDVLRANGTLSLSPMTGTPADRPAAQPGGLLAREREWRELPPQLAAAEKHSAEARAGRDRELASQQALNKQRAEWSKTTDEINQRLRARSSERDTLTRSLERQEQQLKWRVEQFDQYQAELDRLHTQDATLQTEQQALTAQQATLEDELAACRQQLAAVPLEELSAQLATRKTAAAVAEQAVRGQQAIVAGQQKTLEQLESQWAARAGQVAQIASQQAEMEARRDSLDRQDAGLAGELARLEAQIQPAETQLEQLESEQSAGEAEQSAARARLRDAETRHNAAALDSSRREGEIGTLRRRIEEDLGLVDLEMTEDMTGPMMLPLRPLIEVLPTVEALPEGLEESIQRRKAAMHRLGPINTEAQAEYKETLERHVFLTTQSADLEQAIASLRQVIAELDELMHKAFTETFKAIAAEFKQTFARLFGGGSAKIVLTEPDNVTTTGIDIIARPPGKRQQGLALLSGGERALTAAALLFAILKIRPTPFCVLDEVDAALDESNVVRFREMLQELSSDTQFILITHNRGTVEAAGTVYGVTMRPDHTSQVLSYRLDGEGIIPNT